MLRCYWMFCMTLSFLWAELGFWLFLPGKQPEMCYEEACCRPGQESCYPWNMIDVCCVNKGQLLTKMIYPFSIMFLAEETDREINGKYGIFTKISTKPSYERTFTT